jgi:4-amino-4-deoxy-L-arabinose transferase-like glycosyltransferase
LRARRNADPGPTFFFFFFFRFWRRRRRRCSSFALLLLLLLVVVALLLLFFFFFSSSLFVPGRCPGCAPLLASSSLSSSSCRRFRVSTIRLRRDLGAGPARPPGPPAAAQAPRRLAGE